MARWLNRLLLLGGSLSVCSRGGATAFTCDGGATVLEAARINDDYCDCIDGTDETLTPACSHTGHSRFFCADTGALNQTIPTSRVWDGVCDCCDGSDELVGGKRYAGPRAGVGTAGSATALIAPTATAIECDPNGCARLLDEARATAAAAYQRVEAGLAARSEVEKESKRAVARWEAMLRAGEVDEGVRREELKAVEKLEVLLKVYLQDEERLERREKVRLAELGRCSNNAGRAGRGQGVEEKEKGDTTRKSGRPAPAATLGPCEDRTAEWEAAEKVRVARAAARARRDAEEEEQQRKRGKKGRNRKRRGAADRGGGSKSGGSRSSGGGLEDATTAEDILELQWPLHAGSGEDVGGRGSGGNSSSKGGGDNDSRGGVGGNAGGGGEKGRGERAAAEAAVLSLKTYVKQRQAGSAATKGEEKRAEELRKTALLGPVLNDGERGVYLGLTILLRMAGLPLLSPLRGLMAVCGFARDQAARAAAAMASDYFSAPLPSSPPSSWAARAVVDALEGYRDRGLPGISPHLDYRRYPTLRSVVLRWDEFLDGNGKFLMVMWDAPIALRDFFFPARDEEHERPEAAMLREGIARARDILQEARDDAAAAAAGRGPGSAGERGKRRREEAEAKRLSGLELGQDARFAALAEKCFDLNEGGYRYSLCPFKDAKQDKHSLGRWKAWGEAGPGGGHRSMLFVGGSRCHNKKQRSSDVLVECGPEDALAAAEEVEICRYRLTLETPLACTEAALAEAGRRLEAFGGRDRSNGLKPETETDGESLPFGPDGGGGGGGGNGGGGDSGGGGERAVASGERDEL